MLASPMTIKEEGMNALQATLGAAKTALFLKQLSSGHGDYTLEREVIQKEIKLDELLARIQSRE